MTADVALFLHPYNLLCEKPRHLIHHLKRISKTHGAFFPVSEMTFSGALMSMTRSALYHTPKCLESYYFNKSMLQKTTTLSVSNVEASVTHYLIHRTKKLIRNGSNNISELSKKADLRGFSQPLPDTHQGIL